MTTLQITRSAHWMFPRHIHLFGLLPLSHQSLCSPPPPSCTSGEVGPLPFTLLCIRGMWHVTDQTHTHTEENSSPKAGPYSQCVNVQKRFFKASHKQYCCLNRTELLSGALWDVGGVMMWVVGGWWGADTVFSDFYDTLLWSTFKNSIQLLCLSVVFQFCHNKGSLIL